MGWTSVSCLVMLLRRCFELEQDCPEEGGEAKLSASAQGWNQFHLPIGYKESVVFILFPETMMFPWFVTPRTIWLISLHPLLRSFYLFKAIYYKYYKFTTKQNEWVVVLDWTPVMSTLLSRRGTTFEDLFTIMWLNHVDQWSKHNFWPLDPIKAPPLEVVCSRRTFAGQLLAAVGGCTV